MQSFLNNTSKSIYIHIPFCVKKCNYCNFISFANIEEFEDSYIDALCAEINDAIKYSENIIETVYIGGGTPNLLSIKSLEKIFNALNDVFKFKNDAEITMEFNPKLSNQDYFSEVKKLGINRISVGAQSFNDELLKTLGRIHDAYDTIITIDNILKSGIKNYSLDLIYGVFGQDINMLQKDINMLKKLSPQHISTYGLKIEKGTPFSKYPANNLPDEDMCAQMYLLICNSLDSVGYTHYEISNFSKKNFESKHNMSYWKNKEYFGFGVSAHGYLSKIRHKNTDNISEYIKNPLKKEILSINTKEDILEEKIFLGLRTTDGIDFDEIRKIFSVDLYEKKKDFIKKLVAGGYAKTDNNRFYLTDKGFLVSNYIMTEFIS